MQDTHYMKGTLRPMDFDYTFVQADLKNKFHQFDEVVLTEDIVIKDIFGEEEDEIIPKGKEGIITDILLYKGTNYYEVQVYNGNALGFEDPSITCKKNQIKLLKR